MGKRGVTLSFGCWGLELIRDTKVKTSHTYSYPIQVEDMDKPLCVKDGPDRNGV